MTIQSTTNRSKTVVSNVSKICFSIGLLGFLLIGLGSTMVWSTGWGGSLLIPGATLITVSLTAYIATRGIVSWADQRERDRQASEYKHREEVYEGIATYMVARFLGQQTDIATDGRLRTIAALWGSPNTIAALGEWQSAIHTVLKNHGLESGGSVSMTPDEGKTIKAALGSALSSMRDDLASTSGQESVETGALLRSIFND